MLRPDKSIDPKLYESAKDEFLKVGFQDASLQTICQNAGVTTGALYKRYSGKEDLFCAVVQPTLDKLEQLSVSTEQRDYKLIDDNQLIRFWDGEEETYRSWMEYFYGEKDGMKLLLTCADGTRHANFLNDFVKNNTRQSVAYIEEIKRRGLKCNDVNEEELHILLTAYWSAIFEPLAHGFSKRRAIQYCAVLATFFNWKDIFGF